MTIHSAIQEKKHLWKDGSGESLHHWRHLAFRFVQLFLLMAILSHMGRHVVEWRHQEQPLLTEDDLVIAVMTSPETFHRLWAVENTWAKQTLVDMVFVLGDLTLISTEKNVSNQTMEEIAQIQDYLERGIPFHPNKRHPFLNETLIPPARDRIIQLPGVREQGGHQITEKTIVAWKYLLEYYPDKKWFYKCDDDTYVLPRNILPVLEQYDPDEDYFLGRVIYSDVVSGGAGYFFSRALLKKAVPFLEGCFRKQDVHEDMGEDVAIASCLKWKLDVRPTHLSNMMLYLPREFQRWKDWDLGAEFYSSHPGSIHYVDEVNMFELDYFLHLLESPPSASFPFLDNDSLSKSYSSVPRRRPARKDRSVAYPNAKGRAQKKNMWTNSPSKFQPRPATRKG